MKSLLIFVAGFLCGSLSFYLLNVSLIGDEPKTAKRSARVNLASRPSRIPSNCCLAKPEDESYSSRWATRSPATWLDPSRLLPAPIFFETVPPVIHTNREGEAYFRWHEVPGAKFYFIRLVDKKGEVIRKFKARRTFAFLKDIPTDEETLEAQYKIVLSTVNLLGLEGAHGEETRMLWAQNRSQVVAPKVKNIRVEE